MKLSILVHTDGDNDPFGKAEIIHQWKSIWDSTYSQFAQIEFKDGINFKHTSQHDSLSESLKEIVDVRNPDLFFFESTNNLHLGGVEITTHSPDGSNVEKRYPYIWISRQHEINAFIVCPYSKQRASGQINRLPHRHSERNAHFLNKWNPLGQTNSAICQIVPIKELQYSNDNSMPKDIKNALFGWTDFGVFFAHQLASKVLTGSIANQARKQLNSIRSRLLVLAQACMNNTTHTTASSLLKTKNKWVQVYNSRPDSGHWERGEGQFDSIDGRLMFTLDTISLLPQNKRPASFEFWLPQLTSQHPWVLEQIQRGYGSKRLRNILVLLRQHCLVKFADNLNHKDWQTLQKNQSLVLERLDWKPSLYRVADVVSKSQIDKVARTGTKHLSAELVTEISFLLSDKKLFFSSHRAYYDNWKEDLLKRLANLDNQSTVLIPRIPKKLINTKPSNISCTVITAEECTKEHLLMLRQIHKVMGNKIKDYQ